jgi:DNA repair exonuclease SbcCD ATPase subunit
MQNFRAGLAFLVCLLLPGVLQAQEQTMEARLREALRQTTAQLRALQDQADTQQAALAKARADAAALAQQNADLTAKLAATPPPAAVPPPPVIDESALAELRGALAAANARNVALQSQIAANASSAQAQSSALQGELSARGKTLAATQAAVKTCYATNQKLGTLAGEIIDTYKSQSFRAVWLRSYEPLLGLERVKLENMMQDFQDKVDDQRLAPPQAAKP